MGEQTNNVETDRRERELSVAERIADDEFYRALAAAPRRRVLYALLGGEERPFEDLAAMLAGWEANAQGEVASSDEYSQTAVQLEHVHLPVLEAADLVVHDRERDTVTIQQLDETVTELLRQSIEAEE